MGWVYTCRERKVVSRLCPLSPPPLHCRVVWSSVMSLRHSQCNHVSTQYSTQYSQRLLCKCCSPLPRSLLSLPPPHSTPPPFTHSTPPPFTPPPKRTPNEHQDGPDKTTMGASQLQWLKAELLQANETAVATIWCSTFIKML
jgi:hypothetical protein